MSKGTRFRSQFPDYTIGWYSELLEWIYINTHVVDQDGNETEVPAEQKLKELTTVENILEDGLKQMGINYKRKYTQRNES